LFQTLASAYSAAAPAARARARSASRLKQILSGTTGATRVTNAGPRREALQLALSVLRSGDVLVVAGKGHEDYQVVLERDSGGLPLQDSRGRPMTTKIPFSDAKVIREIIASM